MEKTRQTRHLGKSGLDVGFSLSGFSGNLAKMPKTQPEKLSSFNGLPVNVGFVGFSPHKSGLGEIPGVRCRVGFKNPTTKPDKNRQRKAAAKRK